MNIFVSNLHFKIKDEELKQLFEDFGEVESAKVITDKFSGRSKGFGFVEMPSDEEANYAIEKLNGSDCKGRTLSVTEARPRKENDGFQRKERSFNKPPRRY